MGSTLILKVRICLKPLKPFFHQGSSAFFTLNTSLCKSSQLPLLARFLCTRDTNPNLGGRQTDRRNNERSDRQGGVKNSTIRHKEEELWDGAVKGRDKSSTLWQRPSVPRSVFAAGTAKRMAERMKRKAPVVSQEEEQHVGEPTRRSVKMQPPDRPLSVAEWRKLKESLGSQQAFDIHMMGAMVQSKTELDIAKSLLTFVALETGTLSYELLLRYLTLCVGCGHDTEVFDVYEIMRGSFPSLETGASTLFIKSFSRTARWREAVSILQEVKKVIIPSPRNYGDVITAAMLNGDKTTAWALYDELIERGRSPHQETWDVLFKAVRKTEDEKGTVAEAMSETEHQEKLQGILFYMRNNQIYPQQSVANSIKTWFERYKRVIQVLKSLRAEMDGELDQRHLKVIIALSTSTGVCRCCGSKLESIQLTAEEYKQLNDRVMTDIIQGRDVFHKTTPEELVQFKAFVKRKPAFDVVVDGLNVANINNDKGRQSEQLLAVVSELVGQGLTVLVLGRKHMLRPSRSWNRHNMNLIQQKAHCFFTDNISEDDPFLLYATLHSGNHCRFVSRDLMRDHKACLPAGATRQLFFKWQRGHQLVVDGQVTAGRKVRFQSIPIFDTIIQTSVDSWHIPYDDTEDRSTYEVPQRWLCLTTKH